MESKVLRWFEEKKLSVFKTGGLIYLISLVLAIIWSFFYEESRFEPIILSVNLLATILISLPQIADILLPKRVTIGDMSKDEILNFITQMDINDNWEVKEREGYDEATFKDDIKFKIITHFENDEVQQNFKEDWANSYPDPSATSRYYHINYDNNLVESIILVIVDGGRCVMPMPKINTKIVTALHYKVALVFDRFQRLDDYMSRQKLISSSY